VYAGLRGSVEEKQARPVAASPEFHADLSSWTTQSEHGLAISFDSQLRTNSTILVDHLNDSRAKCLWDAGSGRETTPSQVHRYQDRVDGRNAKEDASRCHACLPDSPWGS
jgi:hypothetical protein